MDIEKLKGTWKKYTSELKEKESKGTAELKDILRQKSQQSLKKLQKNFLIEAGVNIAAIPVLFIIVVNYLEVIEPLKYYMSAFLVLLLILFLGFLYRSYLRIYRHEHFRLPLEKKLEAQIVSLRNFMLTYERITYIMYIVALLFGLLITTLDDPSDLPYKSALAIGVGLVVFFAAIRPLTKYYLKRLYGKHLASLKHYLEELKEVPLNNKDSND